MATASSGWCRRHTNAGISAPFSISRKQQHFTLHLRSSTEADTKIPCQKRTGELLTKDQKMPRRVYHRIAFVYVEMRSCLGEGQDFSVESSSEILQRLCLESQVDRALDMLLLMDQHGAVPSTDMYGSILRACAKRRALTQAKRVQAHLAKRGLECNRFLGENVVSTLVKCGDLQGALQLFHRLPHKTVFSWTAVISGYTTSGQSQEALRMYKWMKEERVEPNAYTFVSVLKACGSIPDLEEGKRIHAEASKYNFDSDLFVGNCLINTYGKCGSIVDAENVFDGLSRRDVVSWNAMIAAYAQQGQAKNALGLYLQMWEEGASPDARTFVSTLQACGMVAEKEGAMVADGQLTKLILLEQGKAIHADVWRKGYDSDVFVGNTLVSMYGKCSSVLDAQNVFDGLSNQDVVSWNAMLAVYAQEGQAETALQLYEQMWDKGVSPDTWTFVRALQACGMLADKEEIGKHDLQDCKLKCLEQGKAIHAGALRKGYDSDVFVGNTLVSMYGKCGSVADAKVVFDGLSVRDAVAWTAMITAYVEQGKAENALQLYEQMREQGISPTDRTFVSMLQTCCLLTDEEEDLLLDGQPTKVKTLETGKAFHADIHQKGLYADVFVGSSLVRMYGKSGSIADAWEVFNGLSVRNVVSWNAILAAHVEQGQGGKALQLYKEMQREGATPDDITLVWVLQASSNTGSLSMIRHIHHTLFLLQNNLPPILASTLISAYGRCASMVDAQNLFDALPEADVVSWNALIASYARQGDWASSLRSYEKMQQARAHPNGVTFLSLISACSHAGLVDKCVGYFESMSRDFGISPGIEHYVSMVDLLGRAGYFTEIVDLLSKMPMQPSLAIWLSLLGACQKHGEVILGRHAFHRAVDLQPKHAAAYVLMANIYADAGLWENATQVKYLRLTAGAKKHPGRSWIEHAEEVHTFLVGDRNQLQHEELYNLIVQMAPQ